MTLEETALECGAGSQSRGPCHRVPSLLLLGHMELLQQHLWGSAKEPCTAGKGSVSHFAGGALTVTRGGKKERCQAL